MSRLALLVPAYNAAGYLPRLLESARSQTIPFDETWVYDDCSQDNTCEIAAHYGARTITGTVNRGCSAGKNALAEATTCDWIHFHDADDALLPGFVERAHDWMTNGERDVVLFRYLEVDDTSGESIAEHYFDANALEKDAFRYALLKQINPFCGLYRRSAVLAAGGYDTDPNVLYNEDVMFHLRLAHKGLRFTADNRASLIINYRRKNSMSAANQAKCAVAQWNVMKKAEQVAHPRHHKAIAERLWQIAAGAARYDEWEVADSCAHLAARLECRVPQMESTRFRALCSLSGPVALRIREWIIRAAKPELRPERQRSGR